MFRRDGEDLKTEAIVLVGAPILVGGIALVRGDHAGNARLSHALDDLGVKRRNALPCIDDNNAYRRVFDGERRLGTRLLVEGIARNALVERDSARIYEHDAAVQNIDFTGNAVARNAGLIENDGDALFRNAVEKRALSRIGTAY